MPHSPPDACELNDDSPPDPDVENTTLEEVTSEDSQDSDPEDSDPVLDPRIAVLPLLLLLRLLFVSV